VGRNEAARLASVPDAPEIAIELTRLSGIPTRSAHPLRITGEDQCVICTAKN
jgi:hypothetical protein